MKRLGGILKNTAIMLAVMAISFLVSIVLKDVLVIQEHVTTVFVFAVFLISLLTDGYVWGVISTLFSMLAVNYAFTFPYFAFNFTIPENVFSAIVMLIVSLLTSTLTTKLKMWETIKKEGEVEIMRANLLRAVSHDLRTPLTTIYGSSSAILENYDSLTDEQKGKMIAGIKDDSEWLIRMVENLLSVTKLEGEGLRLIKSPTVLDELIESVYLKFRKRYPDKKVSFDLPEDVVMIPMDPILIEQVLVNILENAVQHAKGMTEIDVRVYVDGKRAVFEVSDDGAGIEAGRLQDIFTGHISSVADPSDSRRRNAGIGLSVCSTIIKAHGSEIVAENKKSGGALFRFALDIEENYEQ